MDIYKDFSLKRYNTFGIDAKAKYYINIKSKEQLLSLFATQEFQSSNHFVLGGGSNVLFRNDYDGLIINMEISGLRLKEINSDHALVAVGAGENWHELVETCTKNKYYGIENLALIPGKVGAAPVQNIGAYGVEQSEYFHSLKATLIETGEEIELLKEDCNFAYRSSIFKNKLAGKAIVTEILYDLDRQWEINLKYKELERELDKFSFIKHDIDYVFNTIIRIRKSKLPDPKELGNSGSFFKNPIISSKAFGELFSHYPHLPAYPQSNGDIKISAAWLIEKAGFKGFRSGDAGISPRHALIIVNYGNSTGEEIYNLSEDVVQSVLEKFNIRLEREVIVL